MQPCPLFPAAMRFNNCQRQVKRLGKFQLRRCQALRQPSLLNFAKEGTFSATIDALQDGGQLKKKKKERNNCLQSQIVGICRRNNGRICSIAINSIYGSPTAVPKMKLLSSKPLPFNSEALFCESNLESLWYDGRCPFGCEEASGSAITLVQKSTKRVGASKRNPEAFKFRPPDCRVPVD
ncbi:hypothetical protein VTN77DRAFT_1993 [Rasamsonia byssochlamydoides]|uniref:uncharacterized protein n=1 Tax=Rasamsonia byssochlamydoides TaxID=89139 RepID=UPI0037440615